MISASALMFGKWFPAVLVGICAVGAASLTLLWKGTGDAAKRMFALLFGLWLVVPAAYCFLHSLALLPVAGISPALAGYGGTAAVMAWFGTGVLAAMARKDTSDIRLVGMCVNSRSGYDSVPPFPEYIENGDSI